MPLDRGDYLFKGFSAKKSCLADNNVEATFVGYAKGEEIKGLQFFHPLLWGYKLAKVYLTKK